jgi:serine/threonine protein phosphatase PrpC
MSPQWRHVEKSVEGASHKLCKKPNQDRIIFYSPSENDSDFPRIMAIADGHGSEKYSRSDKGAEFAVSTAIELCKDLENHPWDTINDRKNISLLCRKIVQKWREKVDADLQISPLSDDEKRLIYPKKDLTTHKSNDLDIDGSITAYGTTLLITAIYSSGILYIQIGDGDILVFDKNGGLTKPIPEDDRLLGNETTSMCQSEAWLDFRSLSVTIDDNAQFPVIILMSSDGYKNSFSEERVFNNIGLELLHLMCKCPNGINAGIDYINDNLINWLNTTSEKGSGDDISVGIICNINQIEKYRDTVYSLKEQKKLEELNLQEKLSLDQEGTPLPELSVNPDNMENDIAKKSSESSSDSSSDPL